MKDRSQRQKPHVVCILVDQLRKDAADRWLERIGPIASRGVIFEQMRSVAPWTYPSVISMLSGLYPQQHGADGHMFKNVLATFERRVPLLQKTLRADGYETAAFITNPFLHTWNHFRMGFDHFDAHFIGSQGNIRGRGDLVWKPGTMFADSVNQAVTSHFSGRRCRSREFTYVHYIDVHGPWQGAPFKHRYKDAVSFIDQRIHELYDFFMERYDGDLLFFVTSDHGRYLKDDLEIGYGPEWRQSKKSMHDFNLRIPFMILPSRRLTTRRTISEPCLNFDFAPTVLDWLGIEMPFRSPAVSLMPMIRGEPLNGSNRGLYARNSAFGYLSDCLIHRNKKYVRFYDPRSKALRQRRIFDLDRDPREIRSKGEDFTRISSMLDLAAGYHGLKYRAVFDAVGRETEDKLRTLGYLR